MWDERVATAIMGTLLIVGFSLLARLCVHDRNVEIENGRVVLQHTWFGFEIGMREEISEVRAMFSVRKSASHEVRILYGEAHALGLFHVSEEEYLRLAPIQRLLFPKSLTDKPPED